MHYRICCPLAPVRKHPADQAEQITQFLYGELCVLIEAKDQWRFIRSVHDDYEGWVDEKLIEEAPDQAMFPNILVPPISRISLANKDLYLPAGSRLGHANHETRDFQKASRPTSEWVDDAKAFIGAPYLWGGKSILGMDCSGLVQVVASLNGFQVPRDAWQQSEIGEEVDFLELARPGDLAFFGEPEGSITHVGFIIEGEGRDQTDSGHPWRIIHASGSVRIDSLDHQGIFHTAKQKYTHHLRLIKRLNI